MKVDLEFNVETLRITDLGEESQQGYNAPHASGKDIMKSIKSTVDVTPSESNNAPQEEKKITADIQSSKLKSLLNQIKTQ